MTEQEYIYSTDLVRLLTTLEQLRDITPENNDIVDAEELKQITRTIKKWTARSFTRINAAIE